jgi:hypothetical protein
MSDVFALTEDNPLLEETSKTLVGWYMGLADYVIQDIYDKDPDRAFELRDIQFSIMEGIIDHTDSIALNFDEQAYILSKCIGELAISLNNSLHKIEMHLESEKLLDQLDDE